MELEFFVGYNGNNTFDNEDFFVPLDKYKYNWTESDRIKKNATFNYAIKFKWIKTITNSTKKDIKNAFS